MADTSRTPLVAPKKAPKSWVDYAVMFRWLLVVPIVLPISFAFECNKRFKDWLSSRRSYSSKEAAHQKNVEAVQKRLRARKAGKDGLVCTARKPWFSVSMRNQDYKRARRFEVDLSDFRHILNIDKERKVARVEPFVSMAQLSAHTVPLGFALAVVPELDDLTVGGLINGYGIEGSSHIYGLFQDIVLAYEIIIGDGTLVRATAENEYSDLYYAIPWSQGTLGLLVAAELQMIEVKPYMKVTYQPARGSLQDLAQAYWDAFCPRDGDQDNPDKVPDFIEGMIYTKSTGVNMVGHYVDTAEAKAHWRQINNCGWWWKPWFYQHAETCLKRGEFVEYIPTRQWYHRHTRSLYWEGKLILPFGDNFLFRVLLGWMMPPKVSFLKLTQGEAIRNYYHERHMCQDMLVPVYKVGEALEFNEREFEVYPIWLCPHRLYKVPQKGVMITPEPGYEKHKRPGDTPAAQMYTDVGLYYAPGPVLRGEVYDGVGACKRMEQWLIDNHSFQALYAVTELTEKDFWVMFDQTLYRNCRVKYKAQGTFMGVYYKSCKGRKSEADVLKEEKSAEQQEKERIQEV